MPRKNQGWITFQSSEEERRILEEYCQRCQRTKTEILRELVRSLDRQDNASPLLSDSVDVQEELMVAERAELSSVQQAIVISARNLVRATVQQVMMAGINAEITLAIAPDVELTSVITCSSATRLNLTKGKEVYAVIKASNVMIAALPH